MADGRAVHASTLPATRTIPDVRTSNPLRESDIPPQALAQIKAGLAGASAAANAPPRDKLPIEAQRMRTYVLGLVRHVVAAVNPFELEELAEMRAERARTPRLYGDLPLVVVTRGLPDEHGPDAAALEAEHRKEHEALATLSTTGKLVVAEHSGHHVQLDEPQLVVSVIQQVVARR
jgi:pimeloyl-ACP methyl ester carboxylesterase